MKARPFAKLRDASAKPAASAASAEPLPAAPLPAEPKSATRRFVAHSRRPPALAPDQAARQGRAVALALGAFGDPAAAMAFLNSDQTGRGRPLDWAIQSGAGLDAVAQALAARPRAG